MKAALPAIRVDRARLANARPGDRERLAAALGLASPAATGIGERALLLIRRMRLERPLAPSGVERFAGELIDRIRAAKVAARRGTAAAGDSVYFEDEVALEVAIVRAWLAGDRLPAVVLETVAGSEAPVARWRRSLLPDARLLPRLVAALVEAGLAAPWFARFADGELAVAAETLLRAHGAQLPSPSPATRLDAEQGRLERHPDPPVTVPATIAEAIAIAATVSPREPVRIFLALCLVAARRPALLTTQVLRTALAGMARAPEAERAPIARRATAPPPPLPPAVGTVANPPLPPARAGAAAADRDRPTQARSCKPRRGILPRTAQYDRPSSGGPIPAVPAAEAPAEARLPAPVVSDHAGLFFFLNIFLALGIYGDFTDPVRRFHGLSPFELLLLLGRRWLGRRFRDDPIEPVLRSLAGLGPRERVGRHFEAPVWQVPRSWLAPWPRTRARSIASRDGVSRWHRQGFPIADRSRVPRSAAWLRRRWVVCLARYIEARTMLALGAEDAKAAIATVLQLRGAITVDPERVDLEFALNQLPLAVRLAGLDRDPGWIPAAGRSIRFHFT